MMGRRSGSSLGFLGLVSIALWGSAIASCAETPDEPETSSVEAETGQGVVGLALEVDNGTGVPLRLKKGQRFYVNQIDLRAARAIVPRQDQIAAAPQMAARNPLAALPERHPLAPRQLLVPAVEKPAKPDVGSPEPLAERVGLGLVGLGPGR